MMKSFIYILLFSFLFLTPSIVYSQKSLLKKGDAAYAKRNYVTALNYYLKAEEKKSKNTGTKIKIANSYYAINKYEKSLSYYKKVKEDILTAEDLVNYGRLLQNTENYSKAIELLNKAKSKGSNNQLIGKYIKSCNWAINHPDESGKYRIGISGIKTDSRSLGIQYFEGGIVYATNASNKRDTRGYKLLDIFYASYNDGVAGAPVLFSSELQFPQHEGAVTFSQDGSTIYFTRIEIVSSGREIFKIYKATFDGSKWTDIGQFRFNSNKNNYSCAYPSLSADEQTIYFASDISGGQGGFDIYYCQKSGDKWGNPVNLGKEVNTAGDEIFPFIDKDNTLYFASNGLLGYGGYDIYITDKVSDWSNVINLGKPVNSSKNDFAFVIDPNDKTKGFMVSNRTGEGIFDNIYEVMIKAEKQKEEQLSSPNTSSDESSRYKDLLAKYGVKSPSQLNKNTRKKFYDELYSEEKFYDEKTRKKLQEYGVSTISELDDKMQAQLYSELSGLEVTATAEDSNYESKNEEGVVFKVQIESSRQPLDKLPQVDGYYAFRYFYKGLYRYTIGEFRDVKSADKLKIRARELGYNDAFVVAFKNNQRLTNYVIYH